MHINIDKKGTKFAKPGNNVKMPRSPRDSGKNARPRASKTVLGTRATLYVPRTVLEALGRHFSRITRRTVAFYPIR